MKQASFQNCQTYFFSDTLKHRLKNLGISFQFDRSHDGTSTEKTIAPTM